MSVYTPPKAIVITYSGNWTRLDATPNLGEDGVHEDVTVSTIRAGVTIVTPGCTVEVTTSELSGKSFEIVPPDLPRASLLESRHTHTALTEPHASD